MTSTKPQTAAETPVGSRTDKELENALNAELRAIKTRKANIAKIQAQISIREQLADAIIAEQIARLEARRSRPVETEEK
jgi:hypothetical protein